MWWGEVRCGGLVEIGGWWCWEVVNGEVFDSVV